MCAGCGCEAMSVPADRDQASGWTVQTLLDGMPAFGAQPALMTVREDGVAVSTYAEIADEVVRLAFGFLEAGIRPGEAVALFGPNSVGWIMVRLALGACGALAAAVDDLATDAEATAIIRRCSCRRVFCAAAHLPLLRQMDADRVLEFHLLDGDRESAEGVPGWRRLLAERAAPLPRLDPHAPAMLVYTSGTTGIPKGFTLSWANIGANVEALAAARLVGLRDRLLLPLPLHHVYPQVVGLFTPLVSGAAIVLPQSVGGPQLRRALKAANVTGIVGVPRLYAALTAAVESQAAARGALARALFGLLLRASIAAQKRLGLALGRWLFGAVRARLSPGLRLLVSGGAHLEPGVLWKLVGLGFEVRSGYGLAETASTFTGNLPGRERLESEGKPIQGGEIRIAEPEEEGVGEIQLRGPNVFGGYLDDPEANRAAFTEDGWFRTGDLGRLDRDGFLYVTGRAKEMIVLGGGKNVFPEEIEKIYGDSAYVGEIAVLERGGALVGLVLPDVAAIRAQGLTRVDDALRVVLRDVGRRLPSYQRLAGFALAREPLPRTHLGKYRRFLLPELYERALARVSPRAPAEPSDADKALLQKPEAAALWSFLRSRYPPERVFLDADLELDLGIDSLEWITLSLEFERRLGWTLAEAERDRIATVRDLLDAASAARPREEVGAGGLAAAATTAEQRRWFEPSGPLLSALGLLLYFLNWLLVRVLFRLRRAGTGTLPSAGPLVIACNHLSDLDPLVVAASLPWSLARRVYWGGDARRLFSNVWSRAFCRAVHVFPVDARQPARSLALAAEVLKRGQVLVWFPEEWRSPTGELQHFQPGIGWLLKETGAPVVPAFIRGTFAAMARGRRLPRPHPVRVRFGASLSLRELSRAGGEELSVHRIAARLHDAVAELGRCDGAG